MSLRQRVPESSGSRNERLCLDFANTADWHASDHPQETLNSYADLVSWAKETGILTDLQARQLTCEAAARHEAATAVLRRAVALREAIYRVFSAVAGGRPPEASDLTIMNGELSKALARMQIIQVADAFVWEWTGGEAALDRVLWAVVRSTADLLVSEKLSRVGQCADDRGCGWLFLDMSRNRSRRWCDMKDCGNRAKARRHYDRKRRSENSMAGAEP
jgi:predicted RNA-binding Zn ribbon-like protein